MTGTVNTNKILAADKPKGFSTCYKSGSRHSSVDLSAPTILLPRVRIPSTPTTLFSFIVFVLYLSFENNENKQKEAGFGPFFFKKKTCYKSVDNDSLN